MKRYRYSLAVFFFGLIFSACQSSRNILKIAELPGFDPASAHHILFLNFKITDSGPDKAESVELLSATTANGKFKQIPREVHFPYQLKLIPRYSASRLEVATYYEHPLHRLAEVAEQTGKLSKTELNAEEGTLQVRLQYENTLTHIDLYSIAPGQPERKIYTLQLKP